MKTPRAAILCALLSALPASSQRAISVTGPDGITASISLDALTRQDRDHRSVRDVK